MMRQRPTGWQILGRATHALRLRGRPGTLRGMHIQLISHASVLIATADACILTDPWLHGKAFNDSWALHPPAYDIPGMLEGVTHLWISHEHPDHFHIPTLKALPTALKERVTVLFQYNNSNKMFDALRRLGFAHFAPLRHRQRVYLTPSTQVYCYQQGQINSALAVLTRDCTVFNMNDAELNQADCTLVRGDVGTVDALLNQFSVAGYTGEAHYAERLPQQAAAVLAGMVANHQDLGARLTVPFASFMYFSHAENRYINVFANTPQDVVRAFADAGENVAVLYPGDSLQVPSAAPHDSTAALARHAEARSQLSQLPYDTTPAVPLSTLKEVFVRRCQHLHDHYPRLILQLLQPVVVRLTDAGVCMEACLLDKSLRQVACTAPHAEMSSAMFDFWFRWPYGMQTLGVSGRYTLRGGFDNWRRHRVLFALDNAEIRLRWRDLATRRMLSYGRDRMEGAMNQLTYAWERMGPPRARR